MEWGDGQSDSVTGTAPRTASHTYAAPGTYQVAVTARDDDGATSAAATRTITVAAARGRDTDAGSEHDAERAAGGPAPALPVPAAHCSSSRPP